LLEHIFSPNRAKECEIFFPAVTSLFGFSVTCSAASGDHVSIFWCELMAVNAVGFLLISNSWTFRMQGAVLTGSDQSQMERIYAAPVFALVMQLLLWRYWPMA
jgi:hypothetical protein